MAKRLSLRARLVLAVVAVAIVGLLAADVATYTSLRSFLYDRTDSTLEQTAHTLRRPGPGGGIRFAPPGTFVQVRSLDGASAIATLPGATLPGESVPAPSMPATVTPPNSESGEGELVRYFSVAGEHGGRYRARASIAEGDQAMLVVATSLRDVDSTLERLLLIELVVTLVVLGAIVALGLWLVRLGLKPLDAIEETASAIAAGDLSRRVQRAEERTEVGRLGLALNASSPTPRTSSARRCPQSARTPSSTTGAPPSAPTTSSARCGASVASRSG